MAGAVSVRGLRELQAGFKRMEEGVGAGLRAALLKLADPVKERAEHLATSDIRNMVSPTAEVDWWRMKIGISGSAVYVAPKQRRHGGTARPNLAPLLMRKSLQPALEETRPEIITGVELWLATVQRRSGL